MSSKEIDSLLEELGFVEADSLAESYAPSEADVMLKVAKALHAAAKQAKPNATKEQMRRLIDAIYNLAYEMGDDGLVFKDDPGLLTALKNAKKAV